MVVACVFGDGEKSPSRNLGRLCLRQRSRMIVSSVKFWPFQVSVPRVLLARRQPGRQSIKASDYSARRRQL
jgi:hypothetical protein